MQISAAITRRAQATIWSALQLAVQNKLLLTTLMGNSALLISRDSRSEYLRKSRSMGRRMYIYISCGTNCANHQAPTMVRPLPRPHIQQTLNISFPIPGSSPSELFPASFPPGKAAREPSQAAISLRLTQYQILLLPLLR